MYTKDVSTDDTVTDINEIVKHKVLYKGDFLQQQCQLKIKEW
jgi:pyruvate kinase